MKIEAVIKKYQKPISFFGAIAIVSAVYIVFAIEAANADYYDGDDGPKPPEPGGLKNETTTYDDHLDELGTHEYEVNKSGLYTLLRATLYWDEEGEDSYEPLLTNYGDTFTLTVTDPEGESQSETATNDNGQSATIEIEFAYAENQEPVGDFNITVTLDDAGDYWPIIGPSVGITDPGNDYTLTIEVEYLELIQA
ncbi:MAG: hypothetical protein L0Z54_05985 [Thermoplasmata archaeon]|nr:hypothetical protein [Thermoplasmata archaeon]